MSIQFKTYKDKTCKSDDINYTTKNVIFVSVGIDSVNSQPLLCKV